MLVCLRIALYTCVEIVYVCVLSLSVCLTVYLFDCLRASQLVRQCVCVC